MNDSARRIINAKLDSLSKSKFRSSFSLRKREREYIDKHGMEKVKEHAYDFIRKKLAPSYTENDGAQTPMKNHPVFIAQHATATCCRNCLYKWYHIDKNKILTDKEIKIIVDIIMSWIKKKYNESI